MIKTSLQLLVEKEFEPMLFIHKTLKIIFRCLDWLSIPADFLARVWVAWIFFKAGLVKVQNWQSTVMLFKYEYQVPILSPGVAAVLGTGIELVLPVLLVLGLGGRLSIFLFFIYNGVAMISYHFLWTPEGWNGLAQHLNWGLILALLMTHGPGKFSLDYFIHRHYKINHPLWK